MLDTSPRTMRSFLLWSRDNFEHDPAVTSAQHVEIELVNDLALRANHQVIRAILVLQVIRVLRVMRVVRVVRVIRVVRAIRVLQVIWAIRTVQEIRVVWAIWGRPAGGSYSDLVRILATAAKTNTLTAFPLASVCCMN